MPLLWNKPSSCYGSTPTCASSITGKSEFIYESWIRCRSDCGRELEFGMHRHHQSAPFPDLPSSPHHHCPIQGLWLSAGMQEVIVVCILSRKCLFCCEHVKSGSLSISSHGYLGQLTAIVPYLWHLSDGESTIICNAAPHRKSVTCNVTLKSL